LFTAGFSRVCISPPVGAPLAGYAARKGVSTGIHDDLYVRALVLDNESTTLAVVSVEVLALPSPFVARVRAAIRECTGIRPECVMIAATHTHAGPVTIRTFFNPGESVDAAYMNFLAEAIVESVAAAWRERWPAQIGVGAGHVEGIGVNRRSPDHGPVDQEIGILKVEGLDGRSRVVLINYGCHPTVLGPNNLLVTGDFPAFALQRIEEILGPGGFALFVNGMQGNISAGHSSELSAIGVITPGRTFERAAELGRMLADATLEALPAIETSEAASLGAVSVRLNLPLKEYPPVDQAAQALRQAEARLARLTRERAATEELRDAMSKHLYASITHFYAREVREFTDGRLPVELQGLRINGAAFIAVPAEVFVEIGLRIKQRAPFRTFLIGLANGYIGYLPNREAYAAGGYEVVSAMVASESEDVLIEAAIEVEKKLFVVAPD